MSEGNRGIALDGETFDPAADITPAELDSLLRELPRTTVISGEMQTALPKLYDELRAMAAGYLRRERPDHTLQPTALVHECYLRLSSQRSVDWKDRLQCLSIAARMMRRILVNYAASRKADKRGAGLPNLELDAALEAYDRQALNITAVDDALRDLERRDALQARIVELRFFGGLTFEETAEVVGSSVRTIKREWSVAKRWLRRELSAV